MNIGNVKGVLKKYVLTAPAPCKKGTERDAPEDFVD
jgi:hypothetical protein